MKLFYLLIIALALAISITSLNETLAQDDITITGCQSRCVMWVESGQVIANYQATAACRDRCVREYWEKMDRQGQKIKSSLYDN